MKNQPFSVFPFGTPSVAHSEFFFWGSQRFPLNCKNSGRHPWKNWFNCQKLVFRPPKGPIWAVRAQNKAWKAAKWAPMANPKVSRVTSGRGYVLIPWGQIRPTNKRHLYACSVKKLRFLGQKLALGPCHVQNWVYQDWSSRRSTRMFLWFRFDQGMSGAATSTV